MTKKTPKSMQCLGDEMNQISDRLSEIKIIQNDVENELFDLQYRLEEYENQPDDVARYERLKAYERQLIDEEDNLKQREREIEDLVTGGDFDE